MTNQPVAELISTALATGLTHPGDGKAGPIIVPIAGFRTTGMAPEMADIVNNAAKLTGEAIIHTIEQAGYIIIRTGELQNLQARADAQPPVGKHLLRIHCSICNNLVFGLPPIDVTNPTVNGPHVLNQLANINHACPHGITKAS